jgi:hypothetical protein
MNPPNACARHRTAAAVWPLIAACLAVAVPPVPAAEKLRVEVSRDLWISDYPSEREGNNGAAARLKLKGIQELTLLDFDPAPLRGRKVERAWLHLHATGTESLGRTTVSTVAEPWEEGTGGGYARVPGATSFVWAATDSRRWRDVDLTGSITGLGGTIWGFGDPSPRDADGWQIVPVEPAVVQARIDGASHGFCVIDDVGSEYSRDGDAFTYHPFPNRFFSSRDDKKRTAPFFTLWLADAPAAKPAPATPAAVASPPAQAAVTAATLPPEPSPKPAPPPIPLRDLLGEPLESLELFAARGEAIGFYLDPAAEPAGRLEAVAIDLPVRRHALPQVGDRVDPLVPAADGSCVEIRVPKDARPGRHAGVLRVGGRAVPFAVTVWNFALPDRLSFIPQMNAYGLPGHEREFYRLAHEHRTVLNVLPYGWTGAARAAPQVLPDGTWDWSAWDARFGPLLDGSAFADLPRGGVPVDAFYLPLNENWPVDQDRFFKGGYWIESAYEPAYWDEFRRAAGRIADHVAGKRWTEPLFEFYLNNKVYFKKERGDRWNGSSAAWIFDEPVNTQDFWALRRFGVEFWRGVAGRDGPRFVHRADISRPQWQRDLLDGVVTSEVVSGILRTYRDRVVARSRRLGTILSMYGAANPLGTPNAGSAAWCVESWALGADGVVPWQTIGTAASWEKPDDLALFYPGKDGPVPGLRLLAFRAGEQLVEYLTIYCAVSGEPRDAVAAAVLAEPGIAATMKKTSEADAGSSVFTSATPGALARLRLRLGAWLDRAAPGDRDRWHDPRPAPPNPDHRREIVPLPVPAAAD